MNPVKAEQPCSLGRKIEQSLIAASLVVGISAVANEANAQDNSQTSSFEKTALVNDSIVYQYPNTPNAQTNGNFWLTVTDDRTYATWGMGYFDESTWATPCSIKGEEIELQDGHKIDESPTEENVGTAKTNPIESVKINATCPESALSKYVGIATTPDGGGYWLVKQNGEVFAFGDANVPDITLTSYSNSKNNEVGISDRNDDSSYIEVNSDGGVNAVGVNSYQNESSNLTTTDKDPVVGIAAPGSGGYWLVTREGNIISFGNAKNFGSVAVKHLKSPVVGMAVTPDEAGYWEATASGKVFNFGDANNYGSLSTIKQNNPIVGIEALWSGKGYRLVSAHGGVYDFGKARYEGSLANQHLTMPVTAIAQFGYSENGYLILDGNGKVAPFGDAKSHGSGNL